MNTRSITLLIAVLLAVVTGWLTLNYVRGVEQNAANDTSPRNVIVATADIPARATITAEMLARTTRPASNVDPDAIDNARLAIGATALITIPSGSTITSSKIGRPQDAALPVRLRPGYRAVTIQIDRVKGIAGLIQPGDRVDVIAVPPREGNSAPLASTILRGVRVLAIGNTLENVSASPPPDATSTATLEVTPKQADLITMADINTTLRLALRSPREPVASMPTESIHFADSQNAAAAAPAPAPQSIVFAPPQQQQQPQRPAQPSSVSRGIPIIDGDRMTYSNDHPNQ